MQAFFMDHRRMRACAPILSALILTVAAIEMMVGVFAVLAAAAVGILIIRRSGVASGDAD